MFIHPLFVNQSVCLTHHYSNALGQHVHVSYNATQLTLESRSVVQPSRRQPSLSSL